MIVNSSPLIIFSKLSKIEILLKLFGKIEIAGWVYKEAVIEGLEKKFEDALILKNYFDKGEIKVIKLENKYIKLADQLQHLNNIGVGEAHTIALAKQLDRKEVVIDESLARETAKSIGLKPIGSLRVLLFAFKENLLEEKEIRETTNKMIKFKFRVSASTLIRFWELFDRMK